jgi:hypothetical protein
LLQALKQTCYGECASVAGHFGEFSRGSAKAMTCLQAIGGFVCDQNLCSHVSQDVIHLSRLDGCREIRISFGQDILRTLFVTFL